MEDDQPQLVVWMIAPTFDPAAGGTPVFVRRLSKDLLLRGWRVEVITRRHGSGLPEDLPAHDEVNGIPIVRIRAHGRGSGRASSLLYLLRALRYLLRQRQPGIFQALDLGAPAWIAIGARRLLGGRSLVRLRIGSGIYQKHTASRLGHWLILAQFRLVDRVIVLNSELEEWVRDQGVPASRTARIANGVDTAHFQPPKSQERNRCRAGLGLAGDRTVVLCVSRLEYVKGVDLLIRAWALIPQEVRSGLYLVVAGDGQGRSTLEQAISALDQPDSVWLAGMQPAIRDYYWSADLFVLPSRSEGMSNALLEAMACGLPCVASAVEGNVDLVDDGGTGLLFEAGDPASLARVLQNLAGTPEKWAAMGQRARQAVVEDFDLEMIGQQYQALCGSLLAMPRREPGWAPDSGS